MCATVNPTARTRHHASGDDTVNDRPVSPPGVTRQPTANGEPAAS